MKNDVENEDGGYSVVSEAERFLVAIQKEMVQPVVDRRALEMQAFILGEQECLEQILPALIEARNLIGEMKMPKRKKARIQRELAHASEHLYNNLEHLRQLAREDEE